MSKNKQLECSKLVELENQLERSGLYTHTKLSVQSERINEIESFLYGLIDTLVFQNLIDQKTLEQKVLAVKNEISQKKEDFHTNVIIRNDSKPNQTESEYTNCKERIHICKAACCKLSFALSVKEIEAGKMKWDLGQPYINRQTKTGYCIHINNKTLTCSNYNDRSKVCSNYTCRNDKRIWNDFNKMELNKEWIDENLIEQRLFLEAIYMLPDK